MTHGLYQEAIESFKLCEKTHVVFYAVTNYYIGCCEEQLKNYEQAAKRFEQVLTTASKHIPSELASERLEKIRKTKYEKI